MLHKYFLIVIMLLSVSPMSAAVKHVPSQFSTIQAALNACRTGDTVLVQPGIYHENIIWPAIAGLKLISSGDSSNCTIDGNSNASVIRVKNLPQTNRDTLTIIRSFGIRNGFVGVTSQWNTQNGGGGILLGTSNAMIDHCWIHDNVVRSIDNGFNSCYGGGLCLWGNNIRVSNSNISNNSLISQDECEGDGIYFGGGDTAYIQTCRIAFNSDSSGFHSSGQGIYASSLTQLYLVNTFITGQYASGSLNNVGVALYTEQTNIDMDFCTITGNAAGYNNSSLTFVSFNSNNRVNIHNSIIWDYGLTTFVYDSTYVTLSVDHSDILGGFAGVDNININPGFAGANNYHLTCSSPCLGRGLSSTISDIEGGIRPVPLGSGPDIGCFEYNQPFLSEIQAGGSTSFCAGDSVMLSAIQVSGAQYQWTRNAANIAAADSPFYTVKDAGVYAVAISKSGCNILSNFISVDIPQNFAHIELMTDTTICEGDTAWLYARQNANAVYTWKLDSNSISTGNAYKWAATVSGNYSLEVFFQGCRTNSQTVHIAVIPAATAPVITFRNDTLYSDLPVNNQWYLNGQFIPGANAGFYVPHQSGQYSAGNNAIGNCQVFSNLINVLPQGIEEENAADIRLYPNPAASAVFFSSNLFLKGARIFNNMGQLVAAYTELELKTATISLNTFSTGQYLLILQLSDGYKKIKFLVFR